MRGYTEARGEATPDEIWLVEHAPVYTQGLAGKAEHVLNPRGIPVVQTNRGGQVTYHGPGQVVAYPLIDLKRLGIYVKEYVYRLEHCVIKTLEGFGITGHRVAGAPGIYVELADPVRHAARTGPRRDPFEGLGKVAALGIKVSAALHVPRGGAQRGDGPEPLRRHQPVRLRRPANGGPR
jgi:lipoyl(octanoyl) transferase